MMSGRFSFDLAAVEALLRPKMPPLIGADISSSAVKMVEIADAGKGGYRLERYAIEPMPAEAMADGNINNLDAVIEAVRRCHRRLGSPLKNLALALPAAAVISKKIQVAAGLGEEDLGIEVELQANQYIPFALEEVNLDYQVLGPAPGGSGDLEVLIAASRKDKIEDRMAVAEGAGLKALVMDVDLYAAQAAFELIEAAMPQHGRDLNIALVDIGATTLSLNVVRNDQSLYLRDQPFGGQQLTEEIRNRYGLSAEEAETSKRAGSLPENYASEVLAPFLDTLGLEVARGIEFFYASAQHHPVDRIVLCGGCAAIPGIDGAVSRRAQVNTTVANPFAGMALSAQVRQRNLAQDAPSLMVACGLALRRFDP
jgi:type IV pilus assembly protein PilM